MLNISYNFARDQIQDGDIIFIKGTTVISKVTRFFTKSKYTHVGIAFWVYINRKPRLMITEAQGGTRRRMLNLSYYKSKEMDVVRCPRPWIEYADDALDLIGEVKYSFLTAFYVGIREFLSRYNIMLPPKKFSGEICSEYVARMLGLQTTEISPGKLLEVLTTSGNEIKFHVDI